MAQYRKDEVQAAIQKAALWLFAHRGYQEATLADIAAGAGVSTGNVYRYYSGKEALYEALVPPALVERFTGLLHSRMDALKGVADATALDHGAPFHVFAEELLEFCIANRLAVVTLLAGSKGTRNHGFAESLVVDLTERAIGHFRELRPGLRVTKSHRFTLAQVYGAFLATNTRLLLEFDSPKALREAILRYSAYHLAGLKALFEAVS
jgi:AcrR family transcriptional regulator